MKTNEHSNKHFCFKAICELTKLALLGMATTLCFKALKEVEKARLYLEEHQR